MTPAQEAKAAEIAEFLAFTMKLIADETTPGLTRKGLLFISCFLTAIPEMEFPEYLQISNELRDLTLRMMEIGERAVKEEEEETLHLSQSSTW